MVVFLKNEKKNERGCEENKVVGELVRKPQTSVATYTWAPPRAPKEQEGGRVVEWFVGKRRGWNICCQAL